jgi:hypothetical protein
MKKKKITHARFPTNFLNPWVATVLLNGLFNLKEEEKKSSLLSHLPMPVPCPSTEPILLLCISPSTIAFYSTS